METDSSTIPLCIIGNDPEQLKQLALSFALVLRSFFEGQDNETTEEEMFAYYQLADIAVRINRIMNEQ